MSTHTKVETELIPFSCAYGECDHERDDECPAHKDFICKECTDALDDDVACVIWDDYDHQVALIGSADSGRRVRVHTHPLGEPCPPSCAHSQQNRSDHA